MTKQLDMVYSLLIFYRIAITYANTYYNILNINIAAFPNLRIFLFFFIAYFMVFLACTRYCRNIVDATNLSHGLFNDTLFISRYTVSFFPNTTKPTVLQA